MSATDSANHFNVRLIDGKVCFSIFQQVERKNYELRGELDPELALNLAAWLATLADPTRKKFLGMYNEITKT
jgi:hypothetical protein